MDLTGRTCRADFRLHAMDLQGIVSVDDRQRHWILDEPPLRGWIAALARDYRALRACGAGPFAGRRITSHGVIAQLGFAATPAPRSMLAHIRFTARMLVAASRTSVAIHRELATLASAACA